MQASHCVLVVDDDVDIRDTIQDILQLSGYAVMQADNGFSALEYLRSAKELPCLILLDLTMPQMDGAEFREEQLKSRELAEIPVIVLTADGNTEQQAQTLHAARVMRKPITLRALLDAVKQHC
jgi:CheY-like chemotaxis protein